MSEVKHTHGPWAYFYKSKYNEHHVSIAMNGQSMKLAIFPDGCPSQNPEADSRLIAAAPDLLEALKGVATLARSRYLNEFLGEPWLNAVFTAIAKAEGKA